MRWRELPLLVFAVTFVILAGGAVLGCIAARRLITNDRRVAHSDNAVVDLQTLRAALTDAETRERGYLLTHDDAYLARYRFAVSEIHLELARLARELALIPGQTTRLGHLRASIALTLAQLERTVALERAGEHTSALAIVRGKTRLLGPARAEIAAMQAAEYRLLDRRAASSERSGETILLAIIVSTAIGTMLLILVLYFGRRSLLTEQRASAALAAERERAMRDLQQADRHKDEFIALLSHELRGPLAPLRNGLELVKHAAGGDQLRARQACAMMERQLHQLVRLVDDLLDVSRITRNKIELLPQRIELAPLIDECVAAAREHAESSGLEVQVHVPSEPLLVRADPVRLAQVFGNLLHNACKYTEHGGRIEVRAAAERGEAVVRFKDTGVGIPRDKLEKVFEMFMQLECGSERTQGGLGIGLALVKRLVALHHGTVEVSSDGPGLGSEFRVRLPLLERLAAQAAQGARAEPRIERECPERSA